MDWNRLAAQLNEEAEAQHHEARELIGNDDEGSKRDAYSRLTVARTLRGIASAIRGAQHWDY